MISHHGKNSRLTTSKLKDSEEEGCIPTGRFSFCFDAAFGFLGAEKIEDETADDGHVFGTEASAEAQEIIVELDGQKLVRAFHAPVAADAIAQAIDIQRSP